MKERISTPESKEHKKDQAELEALAERQKDTLRSDLERSSEKTDTPTVESLKQTALEQAEKQAANAKDTLTSRETSPAERRGPLSKQQRDKSFNKHLTTVQHDMSPASRMFSKFIHTKPIEQAADVANSTIARPNALLFGSAFAFFAVTATYFIAKQYGYPLSGFETIGSFILGWIIGIIYDYIRIMIRGRRH